MASTMQELLAKIEALIREGQLPSARKHLRTIKTDKLPRRNVAQFAELCRRAGLVDLAMRHLAPLVRTRGRSKGIASNPELIEYGAALVQVGAIEEGVKILSKLGAEQDPRVLLFSAFARIKEWDYAEALEPLEKYCQSSQITTYQRLIGRVNYLAAAIEVQDFSTTRSFIKDLLKDLEQGNYARLRSNVLELAAQHAFKQGHFDESSRYLEQARKHLSDTSSLDALFVSKWEFLTEVFSKSSRRDYSSGFAKIREHALELTHWETIRECDLYESLYTRNLNLFQKVYNGTPYVSYRMQMKALYKEHFKKPYALPNQILWKPGPLGGEIVSEASQSFHLGELRWQSSRPKSTTLKRDQLFHRMLVSLCQDFYKPLNEVHAFTKCFPESHYHPDHSKNLLSQALFRLRAILKKNHLPLKVLVHNKTLFLESTDPDFVFDLSPATSPKISKGATELLRYLEKKYPQQPVTLEDLRSYRLNEISERSLQRFLSELCQNNFLNRVGAARRSSYTLTTYSHSSSSSQGA